MAWHRIAITAGEATTDLHGKIQDQFEQIFMLSQNRQSVPLLSSGYSGSGMFHLYFTPDCASSQGMKALMDAFRAEPCDEPTRETEETLALLVGDQRHWGDYMWSPDLT